MKRPITSIETASRIARRTEGNYLSFETACHPETILDRWCKMVSHLPNHPAIVTDQQRLTYQQLDQQAAQLARAILATQPQATLIALLFAQGSNPIVAMIGVLKADLAYVALNATAPKAQLRAQLADSGATIIVTDQAHTPLAQQAPGQGQQILVIDKLEHGGELPLPTQGKGGDELLALYYTSGSTGEPKGVMLPHGHIMQDAQRSAFSYEFHFADRIALIYEWSYTISGVHLIFSPLLNGSTIYLSDAVKQNNLLLPKWLAEQQITILHLPIPLFRQLAEHASVTAVNAGKQLEIIVLAGMKLQWRDITNFVNHFGCTNAQIEFGYGMTEAGGVAMQWLDLSAHHEEEESILAGFATMGNELLILDEQGQALPANTIGEVVINSHHLALGYWQQPTATAERFRTDETGKRLFLTGDIGQLGLDGRLEILGRKDLLVKIRGHRVQLEAIELALLAVNGVQAAAVAAIDDKIGGKQLIAYLVTGETPPTSSQLHQSLRNSLPDYMIPSHFIQLDALPCLPSGKVNRPALASLVADSQWQRPQLDTVYRPPATPLEEKLVAIWEEVLEIKPLGIEDHFIELGGHSLHALQIQARIADQLQSELPTRLLFECATIAELALAMLQLRLEQSTLTEVTEIFAELLIRR